MHRSTRRITLALLLLAPLAVVAATTQVVPCLSGFVRDGNGNPVVGGDLDFISAATGVKLVTPGDNTDRFGFYNVCVLPGVYHVTFAPPLGTRLMGRRFDNFDLTANVGVEMNVVLETGTVVSGTVTDPGGNPIGDVDIDVDRLAGGRVFTPDDNTHPSFGTYRVVIPDGEYRLRFEPPVGSRWRGLQIDSITVSGDKVIDATLVQGFLLQGGVASAQGTPLPGIDIDLRERNTGAKVFLANNTTDAAGAYTVAAPQGVFELRFSPPAEAILWDTGWTALPSTWIGAGTRRSRRVSCSRPSFGTPTATR